MTRRLGDAIPEALLGLLDGRDPEHRVGPTFLLITVADEGWPHVAMLSVGEVLATDERHVRLALWPDSRTTANLAARGQATLLVVQAAAFHLRLRAARGPDLLVGGRPLAYFAAAVDEVLVDEVPYATIRSAIEFALHDPASVLPAWRETIAALRARSSDTVECPEGG